MIVLRHPVEGRQAALGGHPSVKSIVTKSTEAIKGSMNILLTVHTPCDI